MSLLYFAVLAAVGEVNDKTDHQPDHESDPGGSLKAVHHVCGDHDAHNRSKWNPGSDKSAFYFGPAHAQNPNSGAHNDERQQRADGYHFTKDVDRSERTRQGDANSHKDCGEIRGPKARMNLTGPGG